MCVCTNDSAIAVQKNVQKCEWGQVSVHKNMDRRLCVSVCVFKRGHMHVCKPLFTWEYIRVGMCTCMLFCACVGERKGKHRKVI